ncbi:MAG: hypothetical protein IT162_17135 [Bryobacterales bacterium]|nr:hypothetical protein [Bryobacterales bacterium]
MTLDWVHTDCLAADWIGGPAVFVFDDEQVEANAWGIKRIGFVYECLLELPVEIHRGPTVETLTRLAAGRRVRTVASPDPWLRRQIDELGRGVTLEVIPAPVFVEIPTSADLRRFSRYWRHAEKQLLP